MGFLSTLAGTKVGNAAKGALNQNSSILTNFQNAGNQIINTGEQKSEGALGQAVDNYNPYLETGAGASTTLGNALGLNGAEGNAAATGAFQAGPGYEFTRGQGEQAALRAASAGGSLASGNTMTALADYTSGLANKEYGSWLDRLSGAASQGLSAASGQGGALSGLAGLYQGAAGDRLGLESGVAQGRMGINNDMASVKDQQEANKGSLFRGLLSSGLKIAGGLF
jgi:hypothetical protein